MNRFDGTSVRQLDLIEPEPVTPQTRRSPAGPHLRPTFRLLKQDVYAELADRRAVEAIHGNLLPRLG